MINLLITPLFILMGFNLELTKENVYEACVAYEIKHPKIVAAQAYLETGNLSCKGCSLDSNNLFGFFICKKRDAENNCVSSGYISFDHWVFSVAYYKRWQEKRYKGGDYYKFLKKVNYATAIDYNDKIKQLVTQHFK